MRYRLRTLITASAATALLLGGAAPGHTTPLPVEATGTGTTITHQVGYDGRDLFRGLMLGYGPIADQYPHLTPDIGTPTPEQAREAEQLIDTVHKLDPTFLDRFATDITSGNHITIDRTLTHAKNLLTEALTAHGAPSVKGKVQTTPMPYTVHMPTIPSPILDWNYPNVAVVILPPPPTDYDLPYLPYLPYYPYYALSSPDSGLDWERWVDRIATTLS